MTLLIKCCYLPFCKVCLSKYLKNSFYDSLVLRLGVSLLNITVRQMLISRCCMRSRFVHYFDEFVKKERLDINSFRS